MKMKYKLIVVGVDDKQFKSKLVFPSRKAANKHAQRILFASVKDAEALEKRIKAGKK